MGKAIVSNKLSEYQLVSLSIELVHKVFGLIDCVPELKDNVHGLKVYEIAQQWNEAFIGSYMEGAK